MIINYSPNFKNLKIVDIFIDQKLYGISGSQECFSNVTTLNCSAYVELDMLAQICHNIRYLYIKYCSSIFQM